MHYFDDKELVVAVAFFNENQELRHETWHLHPEFFSHNELNYLFANFKTNAERELRSVHVTIQGEKNTIQTDGFDLTPIIINND